MSYRVVDTAESFPSYCIVTQRGEGPFLDTGANVTDIDPHVYLDVQVLKDMSRCVGMVEQTEVDSALERVAELEARVQELEDENNDLDNTIQTIDLLESKGFTARKKTGRPPAKKSEAVAA